MEHDPNDKVVMVCSDCAPKAGRYAGQDPKSFVGKLVKLAFDGKRPDGSDTREHMWVIVQEVAVGEWLKGKLDNTPYLVSEFKLGDQVAFKVSEIEDLLVPPASN